MPGAEVVKGKLSVGEEMVPEVEGEVDVECREDGTEVVFKGSNMPFGGVGSMVSGGDILDTGGRGEGLEEGGEQGGALIVRDDVSDGMVVGGKESEGGFKRLYVRCSCTGGLGFHVYVPPVRGNENVLVTTAGGHGEPTREVCGQPLVTSD